jgi:hypothetical protein
MHAGIFLVSALVLGLAGTCVPAYGQEQIKFNVEGENPAGQGKYSGHVVLTQVTDHTAKVRWTMGKAKEITDGIALKTDSVIGTAYSGKPMSIFSIFEIKKDGIYALWTKPTDLKKSGAFKLSGTDFAGSAPIEGATGKITFTEESPSVYKVVWTLPDGSHEGIGIRQGNVLVAASGDLAQGIGVGALIPAEDKFEGLWTTTRTKMRGTETWDGGHPLVGKEILFGGEKYVLKENQSAPGKGTSELREYLRPGETWDGYRKMVALRMQHVDGDVQKLAKASLEEIKKDHPNAFCKEVVSDAEGATIIFVLTKGDDVEFNLWRYKGFPNGIASVQFVLRNKPPYEDHEAFKAEQDKSLDKWLADAEALAKNLEVLLSESVGMPIVEEEGKAPTPAALPETVKADLDNCREIARKFIAHIQANETAKAVALMSPEAFSNVTREEFASMISKSNTAFGPMKAFTVDKQGTTLGIKDNVMTFVIEADAEYERANVREALRFVRGEKGGFQFVGYSRKTKE